MESQDVEDTAVVTPVGTQTVRIVCSLEALPAVWPAFARNLTDVYLKRLLCFALLCMLS